MNKSYSKIRHIKNSNILLENRLSEQKFLLGESVLKLGSKGEEVKKLQRALRINPDGDFGKITRTKVIEFQKTHGLTPDGIAGPQTQSKLYGTKSKDTDEKTQKTSTKEEIIQKYKNEPYFLYLSGPDQELSLYQKGKIIKNYEVSTAKNGFGNQYGSAKTPIGLLSVKQKVGAGLPDYTLIMNLKPVKNKNGEYVKLPMCDSMTNILRKTLLNIQQYVVPGDLTSEEKYLLDCEAHVLTRALVLDASRGVYIHGTNYENHLGEPMSGGCIRMSNDDVKELFNKIPVGTKIYINPNEDDDSWFSWLGF